MPRRGTAIQQIRKEAERVLLLDSGDLLSALGKPDRDQTLLKVYGLLRYDAIAPGDQDFTDGQGFFVSHFVQADLPIVCANLLDATTKRPLGRPYLIKDLKGLKVALVGLIDPSVFLFVGTDRSRELTVLPPVEALQALMPELRRSADLVIVLSHLGDEKDMELSKAVKGIDLIVGGHSQRLFYEPRKADGTLIVQAGGDGKYLGRIELTLGPDGKIGSYTNKIVPLSKDIPDDPQVKAVLEPYFLSLGGTTPQNSSADGGRAPAFFGSARCGECHDDEFTAWARTAHAHAYDALFADKRQFDPECLPCHTVGYGRGGFVSQKATPGLANVGCESCHAISSEHMKGDASTPSPKATVATCQICHNAERDPHFDFATYWPKIAHGKAGGR